MAGTLRIREAAVRDLQGMAKAGRLWAILDACGEPLVPNKIMELGPDRAVSLYRGQAQHQQWDIAPYLAHADEKLVDWIVENLWKKPWGILGVCEGRDLKSLRKHLRRFLTVLDPESSPMYFRYYDPRILQAFLQACTDEELRTFFGPFQVFAISNPDRQGTATFFLRDPT